MAVLMKNIILKLISFLGWLIIFLIGKTVRIKIIGKENLNALKGEKKNAIYAFWHNRLFLLTYIFRYRHIQVLISSSRDGDYIAAVASRFGAETIRGSTTRGGKGAILGITEKLKSGYDGVVVPDGPQGPKYIAQPGIVHIAKRTGLPIVPVAYGAERKKVLGSWDALLIPYPFSRVVLIYGAPVKVSRETAGKSLESKRQELEKTLIAITQRADDYF
ncbi:MAG: hypothetical protein DDT31_00869 [Syntrophomonadaceae bacterium]|nr:hypothetical protein [Bacillota bacterium]